MVVLLSMSILPLCEALVKTESVLHARSYYAIMIVTFLSLITVYEFLVFIYVPNRAIII